uniref:Peptidyl-prolyl cis-trans isomerase-like n=1 Tax=Elaeis guineensis var. tenera TaxID=51953 RepID=A0A6J0PS55_ELAGV|nr:peptidyl-prolyl cis-trans isomerase-like [Elaeis guineensis]
MVPGVGRSEKPLRSKRSSFHRVIRGSRVGAVTSPRATGRMGSPSIQGAACGRESRDRKTGPGWCRWRTRALHQRLPVLHFHRPNPWLEGKHFVFGHVADRMDVARDIEKNSSEKVSIDEAPLETALDTSDVRRFKEDPVEISQMEKVVVNLEKDLMMATETGRSSETVITAWCLPAATSPVGPSDLTLHASFIGEKL